MRGQVYNRWVYLGWIAAQTKEIALATGALALLLRRPMRTAQGAASVDRLSGNRLALGVASGDRPVEFSAFGMDFEQLSTLYRDNLRAVLAEALRLIGVTHVILNFRHGARNAGDVLEEIG